MCFFKSFVYLYGLCHDPHLSPNKASDVYTKVRFVQIAELSFHIIK